MHQQKLLGVVIGISIIISVLAIAFLFPKIETQTLPLEIIVGSYAGFNINTTSINFGTVLPGGMAEREITLTADEDSKISLSVEGIDFVTPQESILLMKAGMTRIAIIIAEVPMNQTLGVYRGTLLIQTQSI